MMLRACLIAMAVMLTVFASGEALAQTPSVVINEICNDPGNSKHSPEAEFVELYNAGAIPVDIGGWKIKDNSGSFTIPNGTILGINDDGSIDAASNSRYLVICFNPTTYQVHYGFNPSVAGVVDASGSRISLSNGGDIVALLDDSNVLIDYVGYRSGWMNGSAPSSNTLNGTNGLPAYTGTLAPTSGGNALDAATARQPNGVDGNLTPGSPETEQGETSFNASPWTPGFANDIPTLEIYDGDIFVRNPDEDMFERDATNPRKFIAQFPANTGFNLAGLRIWARYFDENAALDFSYTYNTAESTFSEQASGLDFSTVATTGYTDPNPEKVLRYEAQIGGRLPALGGKIVIDFEVSIPAESKTETYQLEITVDGPSGPLDISTTSPLPVATAGAPYTTTIMATGGESPYTWNLAPGAPAWMSINPSTGVVSGTPTLPGNPPAAGQIQVEVEVTDDMGTTERQGYALMIQEGLTITTNSLMNAEEGVVYNQTGDPTIEASGGTAPYTFTLTGSQTLPVGLTLSSQGVITGTPACGVAGTQSYQFEAMDSSGLSTTKNLTLIVAAGMNCAPLSITTNQTLPGGTQFENYSTRLNAQGGTAPYAWRFTNPMATPSWLNIGASNGIISGTPGDGDDGLQNFSVTVEDANSVSVARTFFVDIEGAEIVIVTAAQLGTATEDELFSAQLSAMGGQAPLTWSFFGLPSWLSFNSASNTVSGTPPLFTAGPNPPGESVFQGTVTDARGESLTQSFRVVIEAGERPSKSGTSSGGGCAQMVRGGNAPWAWLVLLALSGVLALRRRNA